MLTSETTQPYNPKVSDETNGAAFEHFSQQLFACSLNDEVQALTEQQRKQIALPLWNVFSNRGETKNKVIIDVLTTANT